jgi:hypothetical protein
MRSLAKRGMLACGELSSAELPLPVHVVSHRDQREEMDLRHTTLRRLQQPFLERGQMPCSRRGTMFRELTDRVKETIGSAARKLTGLARRQFQAEVTLQYCDGSP